MDRSSRAPNAPPTPASDSRTFSSGRPEARRDLVAVHVQPLGGDEQVHPAVLGRYGQTGLGAEEGLVLHADLVLAGDDHGGLERRSRPAPAGGAARCRRSWTLGQAGSKAARRGSVTASRSSYSTTIAAAARLARLGMVGGHQRDRLALVADLVDGQHRLVLVLQAVELLAGHVLVGEHREHAGHGQRGADVDGADPRRGMRAAEGHAPEHVRELQVGGVGELTRHLQGSVGAQSALADALTPSGFDVLALSGLDVAHHSSTSAGPDAGQGRHDETPAGAIGDSCGRTRCGCPAIGEPGGLEPSDDGRVEPFTTAGRNRRDGRDPFTTVGRVEPFAAPRAS